MSLRHHLFLYTLLQRRVSCKVFPSGLQQYLSRNFEGLLCTMGAFPFIFHLLLVAFSEKLFLFLSNLTLTYESVKHNKGT